jgi:hypothetical protein
MRACSPVWLPPAAGKDSAIIDPSEPVANLRKAISPKFQMGSDSILLIR